MRGLVEFGFRRPTLGLSPGIDDTIADLPPNRAKRVIAIEDREPIALKVHVLHQMHSWTKSFSVAKGLILITRDPRDAITSQVLRRFRRRYWLGERRLRVEVQRAVSDYIALLNTYGAWQPAMRWHLQFERLVEKTGSLDYANTFLARVGAPHRLSASQWQELLQVTKESQISLGTIGWRRKPRVRAMVETLIGPDGLQTPDAT